MIQERPWPGAWSHCLIRLVFVSTVVTADSVDVSSLQAVAAVLGFPGLSKQFLGSQPVSAVSVA